MAETLVLALALVLVAIGIAGLAPSAANALAARLPAHPPRRPEAAEADLAPVDDDEADDQAGFLSPAEPQRPALVPPLAEAAAQAAPVPAFRTVPATSPVTLPADEDDKEAEAAALAAELAAEEEAEAEAAELDAPSGDDPESGRDEDDDEDDLMAMFRETKVEYSSPAALKEAYEDVAAADLLAEARALRDLLRRAA
jgi:hypothetical protein